jgi:Spy/CpxP family protein refolding chaperone
MKNWHNHKYSALFLTTGAILLAAGCNLAALAEKSTEESTFLISQVQQSGVDPEFEEAVVKHALKRFFNRIDASDSQEREISELVNSKRKANQAKREALKAGMKDFVSAAANLDNSDSSSATLRTKAKELRALREELMDDRLESFLKVRALLSSEQKEKLHNTCKMFGANKMFGRRFSSHTGESL